MNFIKSGKYYYEINENGKKKRISKKIYDINMNNDSNINKAPSLKTNKPKKPKSTKPKTIKKKITPLENKQVKIKKLEDISNNVFNIKQYSYELNFSLNQDFDLDKILRRIVLLGNQEIINNKSKFYRIFMEYPFYNKYISSPTIFDKKIDINELYKLFDTLEDFFNSAEEGDYNEVLLSLQIWDDTEMGRGEELPLWLKNPRSIKQIINNDCYCLHRCLVLGMLDDTKRNELSKKKKENALKKRAIKLANELNIHREMCLTNDDLDIFCNKYPDYKVVFYDGIMKLCEKGNGDKIINILYDDIHKHAHLILNLKNVMKTGINYKYCPKCMTSYKTLCKCESEYKCSKCSNEVKLKISFTPKHPNRPYLACGKCNNFEWRDNLIGTDKVKKLIKNNEVCECCGVFNKPRKIKVIQNDNNEWEHKCGYAYCYKCEANKPIKHRCFIPPLKLSNKRQELFSKLANVYSYDMESMFLEDSLHKPHLIKCKNRYEDFITTYEDNNEGDCMDKFLKYIMNLETENNVFVAHNGKSYDTWLLYQHLKKHYKTRPKNIVFAGSKIMFMEFDNVIFIDSLNHIQSTLEALPKTFGLDENKFKKGFYPYEFNTPENQDYIGKIPDKKYFSMNGMKSKKRKEFLEWWEKLNNENYLWNHKKETEEYCDSDVLILDEALRVYSEEGFNLNKLDPLHLPTIAKYCMFVFKLYHYNHKEYPLAILTENEYRFIKRGFYGGRTEAIKYYSEWSNEDYENGKYGKYQDIQSLYPSVMYYDNLPYGEPINTDYTNRILHRHEINKIINNNYGFYEIDYEANKDLFISPLVNYQNGKLLASLNDMKNVVVHSEELKTAIKCGFKITKLHKSITFKTTNKMFNSYVNTFLEIKVNCSGIPKHLKNNKIAYNEWIRQHEIRFGFSPDPDKNNGKKLIAKLCLNSLWGKFSQRIDMPKQEYIDIKKWINIKKNIKKGFYELKNIIVEDKNTLLVKYLDTRESCNYTLQQTNIALGASITANARMRLFKELNNLGDRVIYHDTDSIIYEYDKNKYNIKEGEYLGEWEEEDVGPIKKIVSTGAKCYSYEGFNGYEDTKCKGITLNYDNTKLINIKNYSRLVKGEIDNVITKTNLRFMKSEEGIKSKYLEKAFKLTNDKRISITKLNGKYKKYMSLPMGHKDIEEYCN